MSEVFLSIKRRDYLALRASPDRVSTYSPVYPSRFFLTTPPKAAMKVNPTYQDVPFVASKIKHLKALIDCQESSVALWEAEMPRYELLPKVKEQLQRNRKLLAEITGIRPC